MASLTTSESDHGSEFTAVAVRDWLSRSGVRTRFIEPGSPWKNGYGESFNGKLADERLNGEVFDPLLEAGIWIERRRRHDNAARPQWLAGLSPTGS